MFAADAEPIVATLAARSSRLLAFLIDQVIGAAALLLLKGLAFSVGGVLVWVVLMTLNVVQIILIGTRGQSIGKMIVRIAIVDGVDKVPPGFVRAGLIRTTPFAGDQFIRSGTRAAVSRGRCAADLCALSAMRSRLPRRNHRDQAAAGDGYCDAPLLLDPSAKRKNAPRAFCHRHCFR